MKWINEWKRKGGKRKVKGKEWMSENIGKYIVKTLTMKKNSWKK